ncbi:hypothetical protein GIB67_003771 [Kingdonia uniflora]|uniref:Uncharacterized protein n=1 Tax=Kingdonia uniflora TaxID=39325 RepID=A0A7J7LCG0_9MAGN|nr:hypothetical protein GIB67_003771 [Kingdonia uniflora]
MSRSTSKSIEVDSVTTNGIQVMVEQMPSKRALAQSARRERERKERTPVKKHANYTSQAQAPQRWRSLSPELDGVNTHTVPEVCVSTLNTTVNLADHYSHTLEIG